MHNLKAKYDDGDRINDDCAPPGPRRVRQRWAVLAALVFCVGQTVADAHLHLDEEEEVCTLCAISESGHVPNVIQVVALPPESRQPDRLPEYSATLCPRPYEAAQPRAPPVSIS